MDEKTHDYYLIKEFDNNNFELAYDNLIKAKEFRDDTLKPIFKRFLSFKLNQLKFRNDKFKNLGKANDKLTSEIEQLNEKLKAKELKIKEIYTELSETQKEMENLYRVVDVKEREERTTASQLQSNLKELTIQKEQTNVAIQTNNENLIRLENANLTITTLQEEKQTLKSEISNWKKFTVIAVAGFIIVLILIVIRLISH